MCCLLPPSPSQESMLRVLVTPALLPGKGALPPSFWGQGKHSNTRPLAAFSGVLSLF